MPSFEARHLLRIFTPQKETAQRFQQYCTGAGIATRGMCRIGKVHRRCPRNSGNAGGSPTSVSSASTSSPSRASAVVLPEMRPLRGLIAAKNIGAGENIVVLPEEATINPATAIKCKPFFNLFSPDVQQRFFLSKEFATNSRVTDRALIRHNQLLLALYMTYLILLKAASPGRLAALPGGGAIAYLDFLPRSEGDFGQLEEHLSGWLDAAEVCRVGQAVLAQEFAVTQAEVRVVLLFALAMLYSRMVPVDFKHTLHYAFKDTPLAPHFPANTFADTPLQVPDAPSSATAPVTREQNPQLMPDPISFMCPVIDMCNHSEAENVAVVAPVANLARSVICLQALRDIRQGEELTMTYGGGPRELRMVWGMNPVLV